MKNLILTLTLFAVSSYFSWQAQAGVLEISGSFSFSESNYGDSNFQWTRRWGVSVGYHFFTLSEIEFSVQDVLYRTNIDQVEDTTFHDQVYTLDWVQALTSKKSGFQPYVKMGVGQLNREATGTYATGAAPPAIYDSLTVLLGAGLKIFIFDSFALRTEGVTYLTGGNISTWSNNFSINGGISIYL